MNPQNRKAIEPRPFPLIGNLSRYAFNPLAESLRARKRHGRVVRYWIRTPARTVVAWLITSPDHAEQLLVERHRSYRKADTYESLRWALGDGMLTAEGELWRRQRRIATPAFGRDRLREMLPVAVRHTAALAERLAGAPRTADLHREANALALLVLCETIFSTAIAHQTAHIGEHLEHMIKHAVDRIRIPIPLLHALPLPANRRARRARSSMNALVERMVTEAERTGFAGNDLISLFMAATDPESGERMSRTQLRDEVLTFLAAGHETTANGLSFTLDLLARNPEWQERAVAEMQAVVGTGPLTFEHLPQLDLLRRIIDESMRLFPPAWSVERTALEEDHFDGHRVAPGDMVMLSIWATHRNEEHWPDPDRFDPDRFLPANSAGRHRMAFLPFGLGPRMCIGKHFALFELQAMLATLLPRLHFASVSNAPLHLDPLVTLRPRHGVPLRVTPRAPAQAAL